MTIKERSLIERLRDELHSYHVDVMQQATKLKGVSKKVDDMEIDLHGTPGDRDKNPGALKIFSSGIADLKRSRRILRIGLRGLWIILTMVLGALITWYVRG